MYLSHQAVHDPLGLPPDDSFSPEEVAILDAIEAKSDEDGHLRKRFAKVRSPHPPSDPAHRMSIGANRAVDSCQRLRHTGCR